MNRPSFRLRFVLSNSHLPFRGDRHVLHEDADTVVYLRADGEIRKEEHIAFIGKGYATEGDAIAAGERWRVNLERAFACLGIGADFGGAAPTLRLSQAAIDAAEKASGRPCMIDVHGLMAFDADKDPIFIRTHMTGYATLPIDLVELAIDRANAASVITDRESLAYKLFSAARTAGSLEARFVMLVMAIEALVENAERDAKFCAHVDALVSATIAADLDPQESEYLMNALRGLKRESARAAAKRVMASMAGREYDGQDPVAFFNKCYGIRNRLVHGHQIPPPRSELRRVLPSLEALVGHVIAGRVLTDAVWGTGVNSS